MMKKKFKREKKIKQEINLNAGENNYGHYFTIPLSSSKINFVKTDKPVYLPNPERKVESKIPEDIAEIANNKIPDNTLSIKDSVHAKNAFEGKDNFGERLDENRMFPHLGKGHLETFGNRKIYGRVDKKQSLLGLSKKNKNIIGITGEAFYNPLSKEINYFPEKISKKYNNNGSYGVVVYNANKNEITTRYINSYTHFDKEKGKLLNYKHVPYNHEFNSNMVRKPIYANRVTNKENLENKLRRQGEFNLKFKTWLNNKEVKTNGKH